MLENSTCNILCRTTIPATASDALGSISGSNDASFVNARVAESYNLNWLIDGLPAARVWIDRQSGERFYSVGFELGTVDDAGSPMLNTHYDIVVEYHVRTRLHAVVGRGLILDCCDGSVSGGGVYCAAFEQECPVGSTRKCKLRRRTTSYPQRTRKQRSYLYLQR